jgi:hypothetical protein
MQTNSPAPTLSARRISGPTLSALPYRANATRLPFPANSLAGHPATLNRSPPLCQRNESLDSYPFAYAVYVKILFTYL